MKSFFFILLCSLLSVPSFAQDLTDLKNYPLKSQEDYVKAEKKVVECVTYLFTTPVSTNDGNRTLATQYVLKWMDGTDYTFSVDSKIIELTDGNNDLFGMYMAGMAKVVLESETKLSDADIHTKVTNLLIDYCKEEKNNCKPTKKLKKLMKG